MTLASYFNSTAIGIASSLAATGVAATAGALAFRRRRGLEVKLEPLFHLGLVLDWLAADYFVAGILARIVSPQASIEILTVLVLGSLAVHTSWNFWARATKERKALESLSGSSQLLAAVGISRVYNDFDDPKLREGIATMMRGASNATLLVPDIEAFFRHQSVLVEAIRERCNEGTSIKLIGVAGGSVSDAIPRSSCTVFDSEGTVPPVWTALTAGRFVLFSLRLKQGASLLFMGEAGTENNNTNLPTAVRRFVDEVQARVEDRKMPAEIRTATSPAEYKTIIIAAEASALRIDRIPKRIFVVFKDEATTATIAATRFGAGSPSVAHYLEEHRQRKAQFFSALGRGMICREVYSRSDLKQYVTQRRHGSVELPPDLILRSLRLWQQAIQLHENYLVAITDDPVPFKYEIVDQRTVIMHEAVEVSTLHRLNAIVINGKAASRRFVDDFELIWERVSPAMRDKSAIVEWVERELCQLLVSS